MSSQKKGSTDSSATFIFGNEDHTLGNPLRHIIMQQPETSFCGYSVPHPYEPKMNVRIQAGQQQGGGGSTAVQVMKKSLQDMEAMCDLLDASFDEEISRFTNA
jgi:DNA-directed RNA polymerases I and III subunit RPAC2